MSLKFATALLVAVAVTSGPAFACKGPTVIFADNFQTADPAWGADYGTLAVSGGKAQLTAQAGGYAALASYQGMFIDSGDACVDLVGPALQDPTAAQGGIAFGITDSGDYYAFVIGEDGQAGVIRQQNGGWLTPVSFRAAPSIKTGANMTNTLRVTWKGTSASAYVNDQPFITFNIQAFQNGTVGFFSQNDATSATTYQFGNLKVTNVP